MAKVNIIVNGKKRGEQSVIGSDNISSNPKASQKDEFPPIPENIKAKINRATNKSTNEVEISQTTGEITFNTFESDSFSIAEHFSIWQNLKRNPALDKMFLVSTPNAQSKLVELRDYINELLGLDKVVDGITKVEEPGTDEEEEDEIDGKTSKRKAQRKPVKGEDNPSTLGKKLSKKTKNLDSDL